MNWWEALWIAISAALFIALFIAGDDDPIVERVCIAAQWALLWFPALVLIALFMLADAAATLIKRVRK